jgi:hypothetical protein
LTTEELEEFADRLDGILFIYENQLTEQVRLDLDRGKPYPYGQLIREQLSLCTKILELRENEGAPEQRQTQRIEGEANGDKYVLAYPRGAERLEIASTGIRCAKCTNHVIPLAPCPNCGGRMFLLGTDALRNPGLFCYGCRNGFTLVKCVCGCQNPIGFDTVMRLKAR